MLVVAILKGQLGLREPAYLAMSSQTGLRRNTLMYFALIRQGLVFSGIPKSNFLGPQGKRGRPARESEFQNQSHRSFC